MYKVIQVNCMHMFIYTPLETPRLTYPYKGIMYLDTQMKHSPLEDPYLAEEIVDTIRDPLLVLDDELRVMYASRNFYRTFLVLEEETVGAYLYDLGNGQWDINDLKSALTQILPEEQSIEGYEITHTFARIGEKAMSLNARRIISPNYSTPRILLAIEDVTEKKILEEKLIKMATTDQLTSLYNRYKFDEILDDRIQLSERSSQTIALLSLDLDGFKEVNDTFGHQVGDELLTAVASKICANIRTIDTPARLGGDEFAVIIFNPKNIDELKVLAERIIDQISTPIVLQGFTVEVGVCIGASLLPQHTKNKAELFRLSDNALYKAKEKGINQFLIHEP